MDPTIFISEALSVLGTGHQVEPPSTRYPDLDLAAAYQIALLIREERIRRGEVPIGRKIGFTNRRMWAAFGVKAPIWSTLYDQTVSDLPGTVRLEGFAEPRIEPEIVFGLERRPSSTMPPEELLDCIEWVAHGFEIVHSIFPARHFTAADAVVGFGLHGALLIGNRHRVSSDPSYWLKALSNFKVKLMCNGELADEGQAGNVLDGPLYALGHLCGLLEDEPGQPPLSAGEIVSTGTLTVAKPVAQHEEWLSQLDEIRLGAVRIRF